jgi:NitT/TauT family transport system substrate-binding protein
MATRRNVLKGVAAVALSAPWIRARAAGLQPVTFRFNWSWVGNYAPVVMGRERGYFSDLGIDLVIGQGKGSGATVRQAGSGNDMFVWADTSSLLVAGTQGVPIKAIMVMAYSNLGIIWIDGKSVLDKPTDLIGKKVSATPGDGNTQMWPAVLAANGLKASDVELVFMDGTAAISALRSGRVDYMFGGASDQAVTLRANGIPAKAKLFAELGVRTLGSAVITRTEVVDKEPDLCRRMVQGVQRSWSEAMKDPEAAVDSLMKIAETPLNRVVIREGLRVFSELSTKRDPVGLIAPAEMEETLGLLKKYGGLKGDDPADKFYTNAFNKVA